MTRPGHPSRSSEVYCDSGGECAHCSFHRAARMNARSAEHTGRSAVCLYACMPVCMEQERGEAIHSSLSSFALQSKRTRALAPLYHLIILDASDLI